MSHPVFKKKLLASCVAAACSASMSMVAQAQNAADEEVVVVGIRGSLEQAADIKREAVGVVDAISAEDIGKFPDTNLAESLQRITGVSIDRRNGEGASVTIRGFEGANNMVILNGRQMPVADTFGGSSGAGGANLGVNTRSFNFANLASDSVSGIEVYKTSKANIVSGGIGGTINVKTIRPLDRPGYAVVGAKLVNDTTNRVGEDFTPELAGLVSFANGSETFGASLALVYQERDSGAAGAALNNWNIGTWNEEDYQLGLTSNDPTLGNANMYSFTRDGSNNINARVENRPEDGQLFARPNDVRLSYADRHRERTNGQLTLQFRPQDALTLTADFTYAETMLEEQRGEQTFWFNNGGNARRVEFSDDAVATPIIYQETLSGTKDNGYEQQYRQQTNTLEDFGFNAEWQLTDQFSLAFDVHSGSMDSMPTGPKGSGEIAISVAAPVHAFQNANFSRDIPTVRTNIGDTLPLSQVGTQVGRIWEAAQQTDLDEWRLDGAYELDDKSRFDFGVDARTVESHSWQSQRFMTFGNWGVSDPGVFNSGSGEGLVQEFHLGQQFENYDYMGDSDLQQQGGVRGDARDIMQFVVDRGQRGLYVGAPSDYKYDVSDTRTSDDTIKEDIAALYFQFGTAGEMGGMATHLTFGLRYETTDVTSTAVLQVPKYLRWEDNNDFQLIQDTAFTPVSSKADYSNMLPSLDFDVELTEDLKGRFSFGKTIARAGYGFLSSVVSGFGTTGATLNGALPSANASNPQLIPLESDNLDLSVEWYYDDASFASIGIFEKRVSNFIGTESVTANWFGIRDQTAGPRAQAARDALDTLGVQINDTSLFVMTAVLDNPGDFPGGMADFQIDAGTGNTVDQTFAVDVATQYDVIPDSSDPLMEFRTSTPVNNKEALFKGTEFGIQHFFGDTGLGVQVNYTNVSSDTEFDNLGVPGVSQFALTGLSDTYNVVGIYEIGGFSARLAYNWRDKFLAQGNQGNSSNPIYVDEYNQLDLNVGYDITDFLSVFFEGINLTGENTRQTVRNDHQLWFVDDLGARYQVGARFTFE
ncbi:MAG TPA: TonB-dependent receptor [Gammaproteobacteria bacterium]|nr:TonB-dependent receptor [Gammaproteobacteria bacterium]